MGGAREKSQADFDLERFIDMFDEALTSRDERVVNALRSLMMMVVLTKSEVTPDEKVRIGPLRQLYEDLHNLNRRLHSLEDEIRHVRQATQTSRYSYDTERYKWEELERLKYTLSAKDFQDIFSSQVMLNKPHKK